MQVVQQLLFIWFVVELNEEEDGYAEESGVCLESLVDFGVEDDNDVQNDLLDKD